MAAKAAAAGAPANTPSAPAAGTSVAGAAVDEKPNTGGNQPPADGKGGDQGKGDEGKGGAPGGGGKADDKGAADDKGKAGAADDANKGKQGDEGKGAQDGKTGTAPETDYTLELPADAAGLLDTDDVAQVEQLAKANGWSKEDAQAALAEHAANVKAQSERWLTATKKDKVYGGDNLANTQKLTAQAINRIRPEGHERRDAFLRFINKGGAGNHPEVVAFLADLGTMLAEDSPAPGQSSSAPGDAADVMYDHPTSKALNQQTKR